MNFDDDYQGGYDYSRGMSRRAVRAYSCGETTLSRLSKGDLLFDGLEKVTIEFARWLAKNGHWCPSSWHHTGGGWYNDTDFYNPENLAEEISNGTLDIDELLREFKAEKAKEVKPVRVRGEYTQWTGRGKRKTRRQIEFTGEKKGNWIYLDGGGKKKADGKWIEYETV